MSDFIIFIVRILHIFGVDSNQSILCEKKHWAEKSAFWAVFLQKYYSIPAVVTRKRARKSGQECDDGGFCPQFSEESNAIERFAIGGFAATLSSNKCHQVVIG